jgi:hypothetical protein
MALAGLQGPFKLTAESVNITVTGKLPGAYVLGHTDEQGTFIVEYVGRSSDNVKKALQDHLVDGHRQFAFECYLSPKGAFEKECELHHDHMAVIGIPHPDRPEGSYWKCPRCNALD